MDTVFNRRDIAAIDLQVEVVAATSAPTAGNQIASADPDQMATAVAERTDFGYASQEEEDEDAEIPTCLEDLEDFEGGDFGTLKPAAQSSAAVARSEAERLKRVIEAKAEHGLPTRRRLDNKTVPQPTDYSNTPLVASLSA